MEHKTDIEEVNCFPQIEQEIQQESFDLDGSEFLQKNMDRNNVENEVYFNEERENNGSDVGNENIEINCVQIENEKILEVINRQNEKHSPAFEPHGLGYTEKFSFEDVYQPSRYKTQMKRKKGKSIERNWKGKKGKRGNELQGKTCNFLDHRSNPDLFYRNCEENGAHKRRNRNPKYNGNNYKNYIQDNRKMGTSPDFSKRGFYNFNNWRRRGKHRAENQAYRDKPRHYGRTRVSENVRDTNEAYGNRFASAKTKWLSDEFGNYSWKGAPSFQM